MSLLITNECIACDACRDECPNCAIEEADPIYIIDPDVCTECVGYYDEPSCIMICPVECIISDPDNIEIMAELKLKFEQMSSEQ
ncbi:MAG: YfhL family 4Fe-4S dicluster ferredoxin [Sulfurospirillum sp.]|nr:YfhL family 4Fe-4S dicluster ferredoxin [Sulfurospirillum sp.]MBL0702767.1 YfhL family 4Fe-4S dicluster ferredoxin [Sulfurospirillum sp.]